MSRPKISIRTSATGSVLHKNEGLGRVYSNVSGLTKEFSELVSENSSQTIESRLKLLVLNSYKLVKKRYLPLKLFFYSLILSMNSLIPGLPDDLAEECLIRVAYDHLSILYSVCRRWREQVRSSYFQHRRRLEGITRRLFVIIQTPPKLNMESFTDKPDLSLSLFDPILSTWRSLPPIPDLPILYSIRVMGAGRHLLVLGRHHHFSVSIFDCLTGTWREGASIPGVERFCFTIVSDGVNHIYVAGGYGAKFQDLVRSVMRYNVEEDQWEMLTDMPEGSGFYINGAFQTSKLYLIKPPLDEQEGLNRKYFSDVYDMKSGEWCVVELIELIKLTELDKNHDKFAFAPDGKIYCCSKGGYLMVKENEKWRELGILPDYFTDISHSGYLCCWEGGVFTIRLASDNVQSPLAGLPTHIPAYNVYALLFQGQYLDQNLQWIKQIGMPRNGWINYVCSVEI